MDILNADLALANQYENWLQEKNAAKKGAASKKKRGAAKRTPKSKFRTVEDEEEPGYHFIAYVPVGDSVWKLDGLQKQPCRIGNAIILFQGILY